MMGVRESSREVCCIIANDLHYGASWRADGPAVFVIRSVVDTGEVESQVVRVLN